MTTFVNVFYRKHTSLHNKIKVSCIFCIGVHYWFNSRKDMSCDEFYPVFLLYNGGQLNAFGWAFQSALTSPRVEHPPKATISVRLK